MTRSIAGVVHGAFDTAVAADHRQAQYYFGLLDELSDEADQKIDELQAAMTRHISGGRLDDARRFRRLIRLEEEERDKLDQLIAVLHQRFSTPTVAELRRPAAGTPRISGGSRVHRT